MTMPLALDLTIDWCDILKWSLAIGLAWRACTRIFAFSLVDARLRALDLEIRFEALDLNILTVSRFYCLPFWYSDTLVQSGLLVQERLNVDLWMSWCRFCTAISYLIDILLQLEPWILIDAIRFWLKHFFYLFARLLIVLDLCRSSKLWYSCFESVIMDCVQSPQWHPLNWNKSQLHNREFGPHPWRWKWISIIHFDTYILNP